MCVTAARFLSLPELLQFPWWEVPVHRGRSPFDVRTCSSGSAVSACLQLLEGSFAVAFRDAVVARLSNQGVLGSNLPALTDTWRTVREVGRSRDDVRRLPGGRSRTWAGPEAEWPVCELGRSAKWAARAKWAGCRTMSAGYRSRYWLRCSGRTERSVREMFAIGGLRDWWSPVLGMCAIVASVRRGPQRGVCGGGPSVVGHASGLVVQFRTSSRSPGVARIDEYPAGGTGPV